MEVKTDINEIKRKINKVPMESPVGSEFTGKKDSSEKEEEPPAHIEQTSEQEWGPDIFEAEQSICRMTAFDEAAPDSESNKCVGKPGEGISKDLIGSLVRRIKSRRPRKKSMISSPFIVVKRKKLEVLSSNIDDLLQHIYESSTPITIPSPRLDETRENEAEEAWEEVQPGAIVPYECALPCSAVEFPGRELLPSRMQQG
ncbi:uncharacterized protein LOC110019490 [Phalaenopsis equestris]|uniref:uncharacterized protein LOC110019490 n=1 Tax=Phalaenopsis equestris TaxID=78828 RepID=UPI0009E3A992|nr:uncharacterized protein LOC110019490 [Phalaenopsis equestris]